MSQPQNTISPPLAKQSFISEHLRKDIIDGRLMPGGRLPTQVQLAEKFKVSGVTVQRALDKLTREGFIYTRGRNGTFVATHPPHLFSYGVVFHDAPSVSRSRYHELLEAKAMRLIRVGDRRVTIFNGISGHEDGAASTELLGLVRSHQLAGLLLIDGDIFAGTPLLDEAGIFRAAVMSRKVDTLDCPIVYPDMSGMIDLALDQLAANGRRRIATICSVPVHQETGEYLRNAMHERGLAVQDRWQQIVPHAYTEAIRNSALLLMSGTGDDRPDAVFIVDDDLVEAASSGLVSAGVSGSGDVEIVAHCNFPRPMPVLPMTRIGFDTSAMVETAIGVIDQQRQNVRVPSATRVPAIIEQSNARLIK